VAPVPNFLLNKLFYLELLLTVDVMDWQQVAVLKSFEWSAGLESSIQVESIYLLAVIELLNIYYSHHTGSAHCGRKIIKLPVGLYLLANVHTAAVDYTDMLFP